jgi:hypothetical protein
MRRARPSRRFSSGSPRFDRRSPAAGCQDEDGGSGSDSARQISYTLGGTEDTVEWNNEAGVPLSRLGVFDVRAVFFYVDEELTYTYTLSDLALFRLTH